MAAFPRPRRHRALNHLIAPALAAAVLTACSGGGGQSLPTFSSFQSADVVVGQADFTGTSGNQGGSAGANTLKFPTGNPFVNAAGRLFIGDHDNNRVLGYDSVPTVNNQTADFVLGQTDFTSTTSGTTQSGMNGPKQIVSTGGKLIVAGFGNSRILVYNSMPSSGSADPDVVVGQSDFTSSSTTCDDTHLDHPQTVAATPGGKLIVTDRAHNRVLIWNSVPTADGEPADVVLGQNSFTNCTENDDNQDGAADGAPSNRTMHFPAGVWANDDKLVVSDENNNRVLIWNGIPTTDFARADVVLGQSDFTHNTANDDDQDNATDGPTARTLDVPVGVDSNGTQLAVTDLLNNRVLIWNSFPTSNFAPADVVLGQGDFKHNTANDADQNGTADGSASANVFDSPAGVYLDQDKLLVSDRGNNRVLIFNSQ